MTNLYRTRVAWSGFPGAPGVSTFYGLVSGALVTTLHAFYASLVTAIPAGVSMQVIESGDVIEDTTGMLTGAWSTTPVTNCVGSAAGVWAAPVGFQVAWLTDTILDGSRLEGRTYFVPSGGGIFQTDGTVDDAVRSSLDGHAATFVAAAAGDLVVWHRPRAARAADGSRPAVTARAGGHGLVTHESVRDRAVVLTSRRG